MSNSEKVKPVALATIEWCLTEGISQAVSQSEENSVKLFFYTRLRIESFLVVLLKYTSVCFYYGYDLKEFFEKMRNGWNQNMGKPKWLSAGLFIGQIIF